MTSAPNEFGIYPMEPYAEYTEKVGLYRAAVKRYGQGNIWRSTETYDDPAEALTRARRFIGQSA